MSEPTNIPASVAAKLAVLSANYRLQLASTLDDLEKLVADQLVSPSPTLIQELHGTLHKLAGSGGTFGFAALSAKAHALEITAKEWLDGGRSPLADVWAVWQAELLTLCSTLVLPLAEQSAPHLVAGAAVGVSPRQGDLVRLILIEDDEVLAAGLTQGLRQFGYEIEHFASFEAAESAILANPPNALLIDIMLGDQPTADGTVGLMALYQRHGREIPALVLTARTDFAARFAAAQAHAGAFLVKPVDVPTVAERIETLLASQREAPYRVLIVDDDELLADHYCLTLSAAGMLAQRVVRPQDVPAAMLQFNPDLLLLDLYMPQYSGADLARALRYDSAWQGLPIIYLSAESDLTRQIEALTSGADDFLTKPISDQHLVAAVRVRARTARRIANLMSLDSLTGLLKHSSIKDRLAQEEDRARRLGNPLVAVMVDMDHFKQVNDRYGHPMGDQVIKTLAHLLRQRLRRHDSIGRYGGEEFAAVLSECTAENARGLLDDIRKRFAAVKFTHAQVNFQVTLSAGIACSDDFPAGSNLLAAADQALYAAKHGGRNQVRVAPPPGH